jgi:LEA14-like dessication related protein
MALKPILYGAAAFGVVYGAGVLYRQLSLIKSSEYKIKNVKYKGIDLAGLHLSADMEMKNNSNIKIEAYSQVYDVYVNGIFVGKITDNKLTIIPAKGTGTFSYNIDAAPKSLIKAGLNVIGLGKQGIANTIVRIKGTMKAKTSGILFSRLPIDISFRLGDYIK